MLSRLNIYQEKEVHGTIKGRLKMPEDLRDGYRPAIKKKNIQNRIIMPKTIDLTVII